MDGRILRLLETTGLAGVSNELFHILQPIATCGE